MMDRERLTTARDIFQKSTDEEKIAAASNEFFQLMTKGIIKVAAYDRKRRAKTLRAKMHGLRAKLEYNNIDVQNDLLIIPLMPPLEAFIWQYRRALDTIPLLDVDGGSLRDDLHQLLTGLISKRNGVPIENVRI